MLRRDPKTRIWHVDLSVGTDRIRRSTGTTNKREAEELHDRIKAGAWRAEKLGEQPTVTLQAAVDAWLVAAEARQKRSVVDDRLRLGWWVQHVGPRTPLVEITKPVLVRALDALAGERKVSPSTCNRYAAAMSAVLHFAADREWITAAPKVKKQAEPSQAPDEPLTPEQAVKLLAELPAHQWAMVVFSLATGARQSNVTGLEWSKVDTERSLMWVDSASSKSKKAMPIPLNATALQILEQQRGQHERWVFTYRGERILYPNNSAWSKAKARAGITGRFRWHALRHTWATWHVLNGTSIAELKELGGWSNVAMPMRYQHMAGHHVAHRAGAVDVMGDLPGPRVAQPEAKQQNEGVSNG